MATGTLKSTLNLLSRGTVTVNSGGAAYADATLPSPSLSDIARFRLLVIMIEDQFLSNPALFFGGVYIVSTSIFTGTSDHNRYRYVGANFNAYVQFSLSSQNTITVHVENSSAVPAGNMLLKYEVYGLQ